MVFYLVAIDSMLYFYFAGYYSNLTIQVRYSCIYVSESFCLQIFFVEDVNNEIKSYLFKGEFKEGIKNGKGKWILALYIM
mgnify:CR=1 FL=1